MPLFIDRLLERAKSRESRVIVGLDPELAAFPRGLRQRLQREPTPAVLTAILHDFLGAVIEATGDLAVAYKPQVAFFEQYGLAGLEAMGQVMTSLRKQDLPIILDGKRNDVAHTATAYATAWLAPCHPGLDLPNPWRADAMTINAYLGRDGITPFQKIAPKAGLFLLAKTSNPSSGDLQDLPLADGMTVAEKMAQLAEGWGTEVMGQQGYANIGLVVGATYPEAARRLRQIAPHAPFLMPGIGAQAGSLDAIAAGAGADGLGGYAAASRAILYPFRPEEIPGDDWRGQVIPRIRAAADHLRQAIRHRLQQV